MDYPNLIFLKNIHTDKKRVTLISFGWWDMGKFYFVLYALFRFSKNIYIRIICREKVIYKLIPWNFHSCFKSMLLFIERSQTKKLVSSLQPSHQKLIRIISGTNMNVKVLFFTSFNFNVSCIKWNHSDFHQMTLKNQTRQQMTLNQLIPN